MRLPFITLVIALGAVCGTADPLGDVPRGPITGPAVAGLESYDRIITEIMARHRIPGGAIAVAKDGRLVLARGYGWADVDNEIAVSPDALFRIASISKPITAAAIMTLVERGRLRVEDRAFDILSGLDPPAGVTPDPRLADITIEQLLRHSGGWDRDRSFDPMFRPILAATAVGAQAPASAETVIRYCSASRSISTPAPASHTRTSGSQCWAASSSR
jgi:N-acyl-D-amino-acid deacylase